MTVAQISTLINNINDAGVNTASEVRTVLEGIRDANMFIGEVKTMEVATSFITANFDGTGLGITGTKYEGWAICNGNNGTKSFGGKVDIGYDAVSYSSLGAVGGSADAVVVAHAHTLTYGSSGVNNAVQVSMDSDGYNLLGETTTNSTGVSGVGKNMQPYIVVLKIKRVA